MDAEEMCVTIDVVDDTTVVVVAVLTLSCLVDVLCATASRNLAASSTINGYLTDSLSLLIHTDNVCLISFSNMVTSTVSFSRQNICISIEWQVHNSMSECQFAHILQSDGS
jgi:hypothetical protein